MTEPIPKRGLVAKLCEVMAAVDRVPKNGWNDFHKYKFAQEADIVEVVRKELASRKIFIFPTIVNSDRKEYTNHKGNKTQITDIMVEWTFCDGDSEERATVRIPGCGEDSGDKGFYKAFTGSEKYMLTKCFLIPTGDDPEREESPGGFSNIPDPNKLPQRPQSPLGAPKAVIEAYNKNYNKNPLIESLNPQSEPTNGDHVQGKINDIGTAADGLCVFLKIGDTPAWTRDREMMVQLVKMQGMTVRAHVRKKTPESKSFQLISFVPSESQ